MGLLANPRLLLPILFVYLALAFTLLVTVFHYKRRIKAADDLRAVLFYFFSFFAALLVIPILIIGLASAWPWPVRYWLDGGTEPARDPSGGHRHPHRRCLCLCCISRPGDEAAVPAFQTSLFQPEKIRNLRDGLSRSLLSALGIRVPGTSVFQPALDNRIVGVPGLDVGHLHPLPYRPSRF